MFRDTPSAQDPIQDKITPGMRAVTIRVRETAGTAGFVFPGDRVDIMLILAEGSGRSRPYPFLRDVRVLDVEQVIEDERVVDLVTVEVTIDQARQLTKAQKADSITLVLRISGPPARPAGP
ncbi:MAG: Flp pilus assembly protein CpaB [Alphaproteobacteria bacterium]